MSERERGDASLNLALRGRDLFGTRRLGLSLGLQHRGFELLGSLVARRCHCELCVRGRSGGSLRRCGRSSSLHRSSHRGLLIAKHLRANFGDSNGDCSFNGGLLRRRRLRGRLCGRLAPRRPHRVGQFALVLALCDVGGLSCLGARGLDCFCPLSLGLAARLRQCAFQRLLCLLSHSRHFAGALTRKRSTSRCQLSCCSRANLSPKVISSGHCGGSGHLELSSQRLVFHGQALGGK